VFFAIFIKKEMHRISILLKKSVCYNKWWIGLYKILNNLVKIFMLSSRHSFKLLTKKEADDIKRSSLKITKEYSHNNKKTFLKVLGVVGLGFLITSLLPKKADALVFGSTPSSSTVGVKDASNIRINPATNEKLDDVITALNTSGGYKISDIDETGAINYFGYVASSGAWYILAYDTSANTFRYIKGDSNYSASWSTHTSLSYGYYDVVF